MTFNIWFWNISVKNFFADFFHNKYTLYCWCFHICHVYFEKNGPHFVGLSPPFHFKIHHKILWNTSILGKNILDFLSPNVKLHNPYCHSFHTWRRAAPLPQAKVIIVIDLFMAAARRSCGNLCMPFSAAYSRRAFFFFYSGIWFMLVCN